MTTPFETFRFHKSLITKVLVDNIHSFWSSDMNGYVLNWNSDTIKKRFKNKDSVLTFTYNSDLNILICGLYNGSVNLWST